VLTVKFFFNAVFHNTVTITICTGKDNGNLLGIEQYTQHLYSKVFPDYGKFKKGSVLKAPRHKIR
jgi:hypothetical protein